jgi:hypothetical protein
MERKTEVFDAALYAVWIGRASPREHMKDDWTGAKSIALCTHAQAATPSGWMDYLLSFAGAEDIRESRGTK